MPAYREIASGSKIIVSYEGDWPAEMQGAFEYAVKLWEEVLPMTLPIRIKASLGIFRTTGDTPMQVSKVIVHTHEFNGNRNYQYVYPMSMVKSVLLKEYHSGQKHRFYDEIQDVKLFNDADFEITYNKFALDEFDFSLDGNPDSGKYDFVTLALRDIATGFGFKSNITADTKINEIITTKSSKLI